MYYCPALFTGHPLTLYTGENRASADHADASHSKCGTDPTHPEPIQERGMGGDA